MDVEERWPTTFAGGNTQHIFARLSRDSQNYVFCIGTDEESARSSLERRVREPDDWEYLGSVSDFLDYLDEGKLYDRDGKKSMMHFARLAKDDKIVNFYEE